MSKTLFMDQMLRYDLMNSPWKQRERSTRAMQSHETASESYDPGADHSSSKNSWRLCGVLLVGLVLIAVIGTWLVWFSFTIQRKHNENDIRAACQRMMPETAERCFDTVVIQRGGVRR